MYLGIPTILAVLVSLESFSAAKNIAYFYSGDDCKNWNETLASTGRHMDSVRYGGQGCITGPDEDGIPPRKFVWIPSGKDRKYCLHMSTRDTDICGDMDCSFGHAKNLHVHENSEGCVALPQNPWVKFRFYGNTNCDQVLERYDCGNQRMGW